MVLPEKPFHPCHYGPTALGNASEDNPRIFLNYILFDHNLVFQRFGLEQVTDAAEISEANPELHPHELLELKVKVEKGGYIYIYVSNDDGQNMDAYFDDFKVTHQYGDIVAGSDYYPYGLAMEGREITREDYRFGYQGQYAEKDSVTGWNSFELRQYDPVLGRWNRTDPAGQYWAPYMAMGNNPVSMVDPDGAYSWLGAQMRHGWASLMGRDPSDIYLSGSEWGFNTSGGGDVINFNFGIQSLSERLSMSPNIERANRWGSLSVYDRVQLYGPAADGIMPDYTIESFVIGGAVMKGVGLLGYRIARSTSTVLGTDAATLANAGRMVSEKGTHQLLVHGHFDKFIINGTITSPKTVARTMLQSGFKSGTPIRCISCHTGAFGDGAAYQLSRYLKSPVLAPTDKVRILQGGSYEIYGSGIWKQF